MIITHIFCQSLKSNALNDIESVAFIKNRLYDPWSSILFLYTLTEDQRRILKPLKCPHKNSGLIFELVYRGKSKVSMFFRRKPRIFNTRCSVIWPKPPRGCAGSKANDETQAVGKINRKEAYRFLRRQILSNFVCP